MIPTILNEPTPPTAKGQAIPSNGTEEDITLQFAAVLDAVEEDIPKLENAVLRSELGANAEQLPNGNGESPITVEADGTLVGIEAERTATAGNTIALLRPEEAATRSQILPTEVREQAKPVTGEGHWSKSLIQKDAVLDPIQTVSRTTVAQSVLEGRLPVSPDARVEVVPNIRNLPEGRQNDVKVVTPNENKPTPSAPPSDVTKASLQAPLPVQTPNVRRNSHSETGRSVAPMHTEYDMRSTKASLMVAQTPAVAMGPAVPQFALQQLDPVKGGIEVDGLMAPPGLDRAGMPVQSSTLMAPNTAAETARQIAQQIAVSVTNTGGRITEITLNPEELGRVRMTMSAADGSMTLHLSADRPETQDLLRRHIEVLAQEFRDLGYKSIDFSFGSQGEDADNAAPSDESQTILADREETADVEVTTASVSSTGLDLRI